MVKKTAYRNVLSFNWLFAMSLALSLVAFPSHVNTAEACRPQPQRIEVVTSGQDDSESSPISYQLAAPEFSAGSIERTRTYEFKIQGVYQRNVKVMLDSISEHSYRYSPPAFFWIARVITSLSDDNPTHISG